VAGTGLAHGTTTIGAPSLTNPLDYNKAIFAYNVEKPLPGRKFDAYNGIVYRMSADRRKILAITDRGNITVEVNNNPTPMYSFLVDGPNSILSICQGSVYINKT
jgi:hypothetical protein